MHELHGCLWVLNFVKLNLPRCLKCDVITFIYVNSFPPFWWCLLHKNLASMNTKVISGCVMSHPAYGEINWNCFCSKTINSPQHLFFFFDYKKLLCNNKSIVTIMPAFVVLLHLNAVYFEGIAGLLTLHVYRAWITWYTIAVGLTSATTTVLKNWSYSLEGWRFWRWGLWYNCCNRNCWKTSFIFNVFRHCMVFPKPAWSHQMKCIFKRISLYSSAYYWA